MVTLHAPRMEGDYTPLCGAWSSLNATPVVASGQIVNCPACRTVINHVRANITEHAYRYVILERKSGG